MKTRSLKVFLKTAFWIRNSPRWNATGFMTVIGVAVWSLCAVGTAFGIANMPPEVSQVGSTLFSFGIGRASVEYKKREEEEAT